MRKKVFNLIAALVFIGSAIGFGSAARAQAEVEPFLFGSSSNDARTVEWNCLSWNVNNVCVRSGELYGGMLGIRPLLFSCQSLCEDNTGQVASETHQVGMCGKEIMGSPALFTSEVEKIKTQCENYIDAERTRLASEAAADAVADAAAAEADRLALAAARAESERQVRESLSPRNQICNWIQPPPPHRELEWTGEFLTGVLECQYGCSNECTFAAVSCNVAGTCDPHLANCNLNQANIDSCATSCQAELGTASRNIANCNAQAGSGEEVEIDITPSDLYDNDDESDWEPSGGWGEQDSDGAGSSPDDDAIGPEDIPEGGEAASGESASDGDGYSQSDYERDVFRRYMGELQGLGDNPTDAQKEAAKNRTIAEARSEINERGIQGEVAPRAEALQAGETAANNLLGSTARVILENEGISRTATVQSRPTEMPRGNPNANRTPTANDQKVADLNGEGANGKFAGDPVINGTFCYDKMFAKENVVAGPPIEVSGRYCSYQSPSVTAAGALGPGWTLNVESNILYFPGSNYLAYQDPQGSTVNFQIAGAGENQPSLWVSSHGVPLDSAALRNSCVANFGYTARFFAVGQPLVIDAQISADAQDCHKVVFDFTMMDGDGNKNYFKRVYDLTAPYLGTREVETRKLWSDSSLAPIANIRRLSRADLPNYPGFNIPRYITQAKDAVGVRMGNGEIVTKQNDPGPLGMYLLSQSVGERNQLSDHSISIADAGENYSFVFDRGDAGFYTNSNQKGRFLSYALPAIVAPVVRWEDAAGNKTEIERTTVWKKYYVAKVSAQAFERQWREMGSIQEREEHYRGETVRSYDYHQQFMRQTDHFVGYTLYESLIPQETTVTLRNGEKNTQLRFVWQLEHDITASGSYKRENLFPAPTVQLRDDIMVLKPRPVLTKVSGNMEATFGYGYAVNTGTCEIFNNITQTPTSFLYNGHMAFMGRRDPGELAQGRRHAINSCRSEDAVLLKDNLGNDYFAGPLVLTHWFPAHPVTGSSATPFDPASIKPDYFVYKSANPQAVALSNIKYPLHYNVMTETGSLNGNVNTRIPYIVNTYNNQNFVETHQIGETGAIRFTYSQEGGNNYFINITSRGNVSAQMGFIGVLGSGGVLSTRRINQGSANEQLISYEYASAPQGKSHIQGRLSAVNNPGERRVEYAYRNVADPFDFSYYQPLTIAKKVGRNGTPQQQVTLSYTNSPDNRLQKLSRMVTSSPNSEVGAETVAADFRYDWQEADLNPCNANRPQGNLVKKIYPDGTFESWKHNKKGAPIFYRNRFGIETTTSYFGTGEGCGP